MNPLYMPITTLAKIARVDVDQVRRVMKSEEMSLDTKFNEDELDREYSGLLLNKFKVEALNYAWWETMERCQQEDMMFEGAKCDPLETPEYAAWQDAKREYMYRPNDEKAVIMDKLHWVYTHCPQYIYHVLKKKPPLPRKRRTPAHVQAMKAVEDARAHLTKPPKTYNKTDEMTEAQLKRAEVNRRYYERKKNGGG